MQGLIERESQRLSTNHIPVGLWFSKKKKKKKKKKKMKACNKNNKSIRDARLIKNEMQEDRPPIHRDQTAAEIVMELTMMNGGNFDSPDPPPTIRQGPPLPWNR